MRKLSCIYFLLFSCFILQAQEVELSVQTGHTASVTDVKFSIDDQFIFSASKDHKVIVWDIHSSKQYKVLKGHEDEVTSISVHPKQNHIIYSSSLDGFVIEWDFYTGKVLRKFALGYPVKAVQVEKEGDFLITAGDKVEIITLSSGAIDGINIQPKKSFSTLAVADDNSSLIVGGDGEPIAYHIDLVDFKIIKKYPHGIISAQLYSSFNELYFTTDNGLAYSFNLKSGKKRSRSSDWMLNTFNDIAADSNYVYLPDDYGNVRVLKKRKWYQQYVLKGQLYKANTIELSHNGDLLAVSGNSKAIVIWDLKTQRVISNMKGLVNRINDIAFSADGNEILIAYENGAVRKTNLITNRTDVNQVKLNSELLTKLAYYSINRIVSFETEKAVFEVIFKQSHLDKEGIYDKIEEFTATWNFNNNSILLEKKEDLSPKLTQYIDDLKIGITHDNYYFQDSLSDSDQSDSLHQIATIQEDEVIIQHPITKKEKIIAPKHSDLLTAVEYNDAHKILATAGWDGMIKLWDPINDKLLATFGAFGEGQFVYINPEGYYFSSKYALNYIGFTYQNQIYSFEQFDVKYNRPDIVVKSLPYYSEFYEMAFEKAYQKRLKKLVSGNQITDFKQMPEIELLSDPSTALDDNQINLTISCKSKKDNLKSLHLTINGVPEYGLSGKALAGKKQEVTISSILNPGPNIIQFYAESENGIKSLKQTLKYEAPQSNRKGRLHILAIGVSKYQSSNHNLNFAAKDAKDIITFLPWYTGLRRGKTILLTDSLVTKNAIENASEQLQEAQENDVVILFVAGHGVLDEDLDYYYAPYNMNFEQPAQQGITFELFDEILANTKSRKKLMLIDACHSGEIDKDEVVKSFVSDDEENNEDLIFRRVGTTIENLDEINAFELSKALFADMRVNNGATVISSSGGAEFAIEGEQWQNGVFTYTLLEGLKTKKADLNKDRKITISELQLYVQEGVNKRTSGRQTPTSRVENLNYDFIIAD